MTVNKEQSHASRPAVANISLVLAGSILALLMSAPAFGHRVGVFAYAEGDKIVVEGYFGGKAKATNSAVEIFGANGTKLLDGTTDVNGIYSFKASEILPRAGDLKIVLHTGDGHRADYTLRLVDLPGMVEQGAPPAQTGEATESKDVPVGQPEEPLPTTNPALVKKVIEEALDAKLEPIYRTLAQQQKMLIEQKDKGPTMSEIFGGIGWIVGLVGVGAYFMSRNRVSQK
jgi:nickel transport protein